MQRCVNDVFGGECLGTPEIIETEELGYNDPKDSEKSAHWAHSKCRLNPKTCGHHRPFSEVVREVPGLGSGVRLHKKGEEAKKKKEPVGKQETLL